MNRVADRRFGMQECDDEIALLLGVLEHLPGGVGVFEATDDGEDVRLVYANPAFAALKPFRDMLGRRYFEIWPELSGLGLDAFFRVLDAGETWTERELELMVEVEPGVIGRCYYTFEVRRVQAGGRAFAVDVVSDVTAEVEARRQVEQASERYRLALDASEQGTLVNDMLTGIVTLDERAQQHWGIARSTSPIADLLGRVYPDDLERLREEIERESNSDTAAGRVTTEFRVMHPDGTVPWLAVSFTVRFGGEGPDRKPIFGFGTTRDVTDEKQTQDELRSALRSLEEKDRAIRRAYSDVIGAVTGGRLIILGRDEFDDLVSEYMERQHPLTDPAALSAARHQVQEQLGGVSGADELVLAFSEAATNMLKHAEGGVYSVSVTDRKISVALIDRGPGIDFNHLPSATLVTGFSTQHTLGIGFTLMMELTDRVLLCSDDCGTGVILERQLSQD